MLRVLCIFNCNIFLVHIKKLYAAMHEPDGVEGVSAIRKAEPSLKEQILEHESIGLLRDATACYDRAIQLEPDQVKDKSDCYFSFLPFKNCIVSVKEIKSRTLF